METRRRPAETVLASPSPQKRFVYIEERYTPQISFLRASKSRSNCRTHKGHSGLLHHRHYLLYRKSILLHGKSGHSSSVSFPGQSLEDNSALATTLDHSRQAWLPYPKAIHRLQREGKLS